MIPQQRKLPADWRTQCNWCGKQFHEYAFAELERAMTEHRTTCKAPPMRAFVVRWNGRYVVKTTTHGRAKYLCKLRIDRDGFKTTRSTAYHEARTQYLPLSGSCRPRAPSRLGRSGRSPRARVGRRGYYCYDLDGHQGEEKVMSQTSATR
jgi:hypothetical protein